MKTLYLFPDTNVFLQCKPLSQVDWSVMSGFDAIELVLTRPVQSELDSLKGNGNGRRAMRARTASTLMRELLESEDGTKRLRKSAPIVDLRLDIRLRVDPSAEGVLDYGERDDQLVGITLGFMGAHPGAAVKLLTNDTGPMASAKAVGVTYQVIPDDWFLPPEEDESSKQAKALKEELDLYKNQEPKFRVEHAYASDKRFTATMTTYEALSDDQIADLVERLRAKHAMATDFGEVEEPDPNAPKDFFDLSKLAGHTEGLKRVTPAEIDRYRSSYEDWISDCRTKLTGYANALQREQAWPQFTITADNFGARPADDALIVFEVEGQVWICVPDRGDDSKPQTTAIERGLELPQPPAAPQSRWVGKGDIRVGTLFRQSASPLGSATMLDLPSFYSPKPRDPNGFYLKVGRRGSPSQRIEYECDQWRHAQGREDFSFDVFVNLQPGEYAGVVKVGVHAANLTRPALMTLPISITVIRASCFEEAVAMVDAVKEPSSSYRLEIGKRNLSRRDR